MGQLTLMFQFIYLGEMEIKVIIFPTCEEFSDLKLHCLGVGKQGLLRIPKYSWELRMGSSPQPGWTGSWAGNYFIVPKL